MPLRRFIQGRCKSATQHNYDRTLDLRGLECPLPVMKAKQALERMDPGTVLRVVATDRATLKNIATYAARSGNELIESAAPRGEYHYLIRRISRQGAA